MAHIITHLYAESFWDYMHEEQIKLKADSP